MPSKLFKAAQDMPDSSPQGGGSTAGPSSSIAETSNRPKVVLAPTSHSVRAPRDTLEPHPYLRPNTGVEFATRTVSRETDSNVELDEHYCADDRDSRDSMQSLSDPGGCKQLAWQLSDQTWSVVGGDCPAPAIPLGVPRSISRSVKLPQFCYFCKTNNYH
jgi:hypothetical protein